MVHAAYLLIAMAACDEAVLDLGATLPASVHVSKTHPTTLVFARPIREVAVADSRFLTQPSQPHDREVALTASGGLAETTATFRFAEGVNLGPLTLVRDETAPCVVRVHWPLWAQLDSLKAELEHAQEESRQLRANPAVATIGRALLEQPKDRPSMFRVETRKLTGRAQAGDVTVDSMLAYWLFDLAYVVLRIDTSDPTWEFARVSAKGASIVGTFVDPEFNRREPRQVVIAVRKQGKDRGPVTLIVHDLSNRRSIQLPQMDLQ